MGLIARPNQVGPNWLVFFVIVLANGQTSAPAFTDYLGVRIGMTATEVREKLGKPRSKDKAQDLFVCGEKESAQVFYDEQEKVYAVSIDFTGKNNDAPSARDVLGEDITARPDGSMYRMKQYRDEGYWLSYNRTTFTQEQPCRRYLY